MKEIGRMVKKMVKVSIYVKKVQDTKAFGKEIINKEKASYFIVTVIDTLEHSKRGRRRVIVYINSIMGMYIQESLIKISEMAMEY